MRQSRLLIGYAVMFGTLAAVAPSVASCLASPHQVKEVRILDCRDPSPYVAISIDRMLIDPKPWQPSFDEDSARQIASQIPSAVILVVTTSETTLYPEQHRTGDGEVTTRGRITSPWNEVDRYERLWWRFEDGQSCKDFPRLSERRVIVRSPCCDVPGSTFVPCFAKLDIVSDVPDWAVTVIGSREANVGRQAN